MVNFWSAVFVLPQTFYAKIDSLCAAFLWRNHTGSASGARVAWKDVCKPKAEGGLGLRPLEEFGTVFTLKRVWIFFSSSGSLWVDWLKNHVFHREGFWSLSYYPRLSPTVRSMLQLHHVVSEFMRCEVGNGGTASFWFDHWTRLGPLILFAGQNTPRSLRIRKNAKVIEATRNGEWLMPAARSQELQRLETHHHLFFECEYSSALWQPCASTVWPLPPTYIHSAASWILRPQQASNSSSAVIVKLVFQSSVYLIWKERNARIFTATSTPPQVLQKALDRLIRDRLLSFPASTPSSPSMLELYFSFCPP
ncbi:BnaC06g14470D [Brassica napus]|uniref:BnaC06g14470D protein n=1 Tax=Brassica napus TaxID=3708 RepID=A0A078FFY0_BRANA|nr:BnaC06g14470D [Brassica napus]